jgi:hypothetical protein
VKVEIQQAEIFGPILIKKGKMFEEDVFDPDAVPQQVGATAS